jgi:hypothetical protein
VTRQTGLPKILRYTALPEHWDLAKNARKDSSRCVHAQAIIALLGPRSRPRVDTDFIRVTDPDTGDRYIYKTPSSVQGSLLAFDAGFERTEPMPVSARVVQIKRKRSNQTSLSDVRAWAKTQPELSSAVGMHGPIPSPVIEAYKLAHPGEHVHSQAGYKRNRGGRLPYAETAHNATEPLPGHLPGGHNVSPDKRRTFGSQSLTRALVADGWAPPTS